MTPVAPDVTTIADLSALIPPERLRLIRTDPSDATLAGVSYLTVPMLQSYARGGTPPEPSLVEDTAAVLDDPRAADPDHDYVVDIAIRYCAEHGIPLLLLVGVSKLPRSAEILAAQLHLSIGSMPRTSHTETVAEIEIMLSRADLRLAEAVRAVNSALSASQEQLSEILSTIAEQAKGVVALQSGNRLLQAARSTAGTDGERGVLLFAPMPIRRAPVPYTDIVNGRSVAVAPVPLPQALSERGLLLIAQQRGGGPLWRSLALETLLAARNVVSAWAINDLLSNDRRRFGWSTMLQQVIDSPLGLPHSLVDATSDLGWHLDAWHLGVHLRFADGVPMRSAELSELDQLLVEAEVDATALVPRSGGAVCWVSAPDIRQLPTQRDLAERVDEAIGFAIELESSRPVIAGVGTPHQGVAGLAESLRSAQQNSVLPAEGGLRHTRLGNRHAVDRVLALWEADPLLRQECETLLKPLQEEAVLRETLSVFLSQGGSQAATARELGVHRNTIRYRLERIRDAVDADVDEPTTRTALSVALHLSGAAVHSR